MIEDDATDVELREGMLADLRQWRANGANTFGGYYSITDEELDMLLAIADERDELASLLEEEYGPRHRPIAPLPLKVTAPMPAVEISIEPDDEGVATRAAGVPVPLDLRRSTNCPCSLLPATPSGHEPKPTCKGCGSPIEFRGYPAGWKHVLSLLERHAAGLDVDHYAGPIE